MDKEFVVKCTIGVSFKSREDAYNFLESWRNFIDESVPVDAYDYHDISLNSRINDTNDWGDPK